jgi:hypothetical protein
MQALFHYCQNAEKSSNKLKSKQNWIFMASLAMNPRENWVSDLTQMCGNSRIDRRFNQAVLRIPSLIASSILTSSFAGPILWEYWEENFFH